MTWNEDFPYLELVHSQVREEDNHVFLYTDNKPSVSLVAASNHLHVISLTEILFQLMSHELKLILEVFVPG